MSYALSDVFAYGAQAGDELGEVDRGREGVAEEGAQNNRGEISVKPRAPPARDSNEVVKHHSDLIGTVDRNDSD